jgi:hypothetical protein
MIDASRLRHRSEVYEVFCWRCHRTIELPASARPYRCFHCGALLVIEWPSVRSPLCAARRVTQRNRIFTEKDARKEPGRILTETAQDALDHATGLEKR